MRIIPNQSEKRIVSRLMENGQKSIRLNLTNSEKPIRMNPKFGLDQSGIGLIRIYLDWKLVFGLVWIHSNWFLGINQIKSD